MEEMWPFCGTTQKVFKRVEKFLDERDYLKRGGVRDDTLPWRCFHSRAVR
jgi:hypothetical protein